MERRLTEADGREALRDHVVEKALSARGTYGRGDVVAGEPAIDRDGMCALLEDRAVVRYPTALRFGAAELEPGEFAYAQPLGAHPRDGFCLWVHPAFEARPDILPLLIAYHIVRINYGEIATHEEAELFGAALMGMSVEDYYRVLCEAADAVSGHAR